MMRLTKLNTEFRFRHRLMMRVMELAARRKVPDVVRMHFYRYDFFGKHFGALTQEALRGLSEWDVFERELMAAFVSSLNQCVF
jgi:hypothetical protein